MERKPAGTSPVRQVGMGPAGGRRNGASGGTAPRDKRNGRTDDWSGFAKGVATGTFVTLSVCFIALGAWFRSEGGAPYRHMLGDEARARLGGIPATIETPEQQTRATDASPPRPQAGGFHDEAPATVVSTAPEPGAPSAQEPGGAPAGPSDGLEGLGLDELLKAQDRNAKVVGQAGKLLKAIGGSSR